MFRSTQQIYTLRKHIVELVAVTVAEDGTIMEKPQPRQMVRVEPTPVRGVWPFLLPAVDADFGVAAAHLTVHYGIRPSQLRIQV